MKSSSINYYKKIKIIDLTRDEEIAIIKKIQSGDKESKIFFIKNNIPLVVSVVKELNNHGIPQDDLIQEGIVALMRIINKFDVTKGFRFYTYAKPCLKKSIIEYIESHSRNIQIPSHFAKEIGKYNQAYELLTNKLNRIPTIEELAKSLNEKPKTINLIQNNILNASTLSIQEILETTPNAEDIEFFQTSENNINNQLITDPKILIEQLSIKEIYTTLLQIKEEEGITDSDFDIFMRNSFYQKGEELYLTQEELAKIYHASYQNIHNIISRVRVSIMSSDLIKNLIDFSDHKIEINKIRSKRYQGKKISK